MTGRKKRTQPRERGDPSDDQAAPLISSRQREREFDEVSNGIRSNKAGSSRSRPGNNGDDGGRGTSTSGGRGQQSSSNNNHSRQKQPQRSSTKPPQQQSSVQSNNTLGKFIGREFTAPNNNEGSIAQSQLTTPSALLIDDDNSSYSTVHSQDKQPLLLKSTSNGRTKNGKRSPPNNRHGQKSNGNRVGFGPSSSSSGGGGTKGVQRGTSALSMRKGSSNKRPWFKSYNSSTFATTNNGKHTNGGTLYTALANTNGPRNNLSSSTTVTASITGVQYRSATSTQRALEEIKRKKIEMQEKQRAMFIMVGLFLLAGLVHFTGSGSSSNNSGGGVLKSLLGGGSSTVEQVDSSMGVRGGSKDKVYGDTKDLGYGGERTQLDASGVPIAGGASISTADGGGGLAVPSATEGGGTQQSVEAYGSASAAGGTTSEYGDEYTYELPPPTEKEYDAEHEFLVPIRHFADVTDHVRPEDTAFFFHVPRAGGSTIKSIIGKCLHLVQSSEVGVRDGHDRDTMLQVLDVEGNSYVNVDTTTIPGIQHSVDLGLAQSGLANVIVSSYFQDSAALFDLEHQGRAFILFRDPIERATSMYWHRVKELGDLDTSVSIEDYAQGNGIENNWMCRFLTNSMTGELTKDDLEQAKEILKTKFLIGFIDDLDESVYRMMKYNGWKFSVDETEQMKEEDCIKDLTTGGTNINEYEYEIPKRGSQAHALISWQTQFDMKLYAYAKELFDHQTKEWGTKERKKMLKKEKKKAKGG